MANKKFFGFLLFISGLFLIVLFMCFVFAASVAPTGLIFRNNVTVNYDEGNFTVNWTSGGGDENDYFIYISIDGGTSWFTKVNNNSLLGYSFNNHTEANYTFRIEAVNATGDAANSTIDLSMYVDRTAPVITLPHYTNATFKKNTDTLTLNISVADTHSGETGSICLIDVNGTSNQTVLVSNGWCNSSVINLTGSIDGNHTLRIYVNDTVNNWGLNDSYVVRIDSTSPISSFGTNPLANLNRSNSSTTFDLKCSNNLGSISSISLYGNWSSGWHANYTNTSYINNTWINTTVAGVSDGVYLWGVYCNDSAGNSDWTDVNRTLIIDTTSPSVSFSCSSTSVRAGDTITFSCSGTDAVSGVQTTSYTSSILTSSTGTFSTTCTVTDYANNSASSSIGYTVSGSESGGSSTANEWSEQKVHSWTKMSPGVAVIMKTFNKEYGLKQIQIEVDDEAQNVKMIVKKYDSKPAEVSKEKTGKVNKYLQIETTNLEGKLSKAILTIQLEKSWVSDNSLDKDKISLFKFDEENNEWNELTTTYKEEDTTYYYYDIELTSFSYFAVGEKVVTEEEESSAIIEGEDEEGDKDEIEGGSLIWLWIILGILVLGIGGWFLFKKIKK